MKGIMFKPDMIKVIVEGRKTVTRRVIKLPEAPNHLGQWESIYLGGNGVTKDSRGEIVPRYDGIWHTRTGKFIKARYQVGEVLYIKEAWNSVYEDDKLIEYWYKLGGPTVRHWHSPMMMPEKAARYFITIIDARAERLQKITKDYAEIMAEGFSIEIANWDRGWLWYQALWDSINKNYPWESNPFVWRYEFALTSSGETK